MFCSIKNNSLFDIVFSSNFIKNEPYIKGVQYVNKTQNMDQCKKFIHLGQLILMICEETVQAITACHYKQFDALVKNFGCQITALENFEISDQPDIKNEAWAIQLCVKKNLEHLKSIQNKPPLEHNIRGFEDYLNQLKVTILVSDPMARLIRFKILNIINSNKILVDKDGIRREVPITKIENLKKRIKNLPITTQEMKALEKFPFKSWVEGLQLEESEKAVRYIQSMAKTILCPDRDGILGEMLSDEFVRISKKSKPQVKSQPQLHSCEAAVRCIKGYVLIKNKLFLGEFPREGAQPVRQMIKMPEGLFLTEDEEKLLDHQTAVFVIEVLMASHVNRDAIKMIISEAGIVNFVNATVSRLPQYLEGTDGEKLQDDAIQEDIQAYHNDKYKEIYQMAEIEHIYTSSWQDEK
ncbi:MAG: hypothetical protein H0V82_12755 [Candidatus Protochlamydia sp.]|nr:hypothetical protein [Candidatus Protochlamydia sp.]